MTDHSQASLVVLKGNLIVTVATRGVTAQTESVIQKECLTPIANELLAK